MKQIIFIKSELSITDYYKQGEVIGAINSEIKKTYINGILS